MKRTPWFRARSESPVRTGWYEYRGPALRDGCRFYWNGREWGRFVETTGGQRWLALWGGPGSHDYWRGLTQPAGEGER